jgi:hypothetical protein
MQQLTCATLAPGDLLLKAAGNNLTNRAISFGQWLAGPNHQIAHAAVMVDRMYCVEASGGGLHGSDLRIQNKDCGYLVFRPSNRAIAEGAATCALMLLDIHAQGGGIGYNLRGAVASLFGGGKVKSSSDIQQLLDRILAGKQSTMYCSQFAVFVYQFVAEQSRIDPRRIFNIADSRVSPAKLASLLVGNPGFNEVGYIMPGAR